MIASRNGWFAFVYFCAVFGVVSESEVSCWEGDGSLGLLSVGTRDSTSGDTLSLTQHQWGQAKMSTDW